MKANLSLLCHNLRNQFARYGLERRRILSSIAAMDVLFATNERSLSQYVILECSDKSCSNAIQELPDQSDEVRTEKPYRLPIMFTTLVFIQFGFVVLMFPYLFLRSSLPGWIFFLLILLVLSITLSFLAFGIKRDVLCRERILTQIHQNIRDEIRLAASLSDPGAYKI